LQDAAAKQAALDAAAAKAQQASEDAAALAQAKAERWLLHYFLFIESAII
jgi:hypothetical protein